MRLYTPLCNIIKLSKFFESCVCEDIASFCVPMLFDHDLGFIFLLGYAGLARRFKTKSYTR